MPYFRFFAAHKAILSLGMLLTFSSSFGQTFLISLFVPHFLAAFALTPGEFGLLYSAATLLAAACLPFLGGLLDRTDLRTYAVAATVGLALSSLTVGLSSGALLLFIGLIGLRLTGQGLLTHTALTSMAREFTHLRGKALALANTGFPLGEAVFPLLVAFLLPRAGWRLSWAIIFGFISLAVLPLLLGLLRRIGGPKSDRNPAALSDSIPSPSPPRLDARTRSAILKDPRFYFLVAGALALPFILTGLFLYQLELARLKGWPEMVMASAFLGFAGGRILLSLLAGPWVDKWGARRLYPLYLLPLGLALLGLAGLSATWVPLACFFLAGASQGVAGVLKSALWAEVYGTEFLGTVRSLITSLMVFATASSPALFGWLLDQGIPVTNILFGTLLLVLVAMASAWWACADLTREGVGRAAIEPGIEKAAP